MSGCARPWTGWGSSITRNDRRPLLTLFNLPDFSGWVPPCHWSNDDFLPDHLYDLGSCVLCHRFRDLPRVIVTVFEDTELGQLPRGEDLLDIPEILFCQGRFSEILYR